MTWSDTPQLSVYLDRAEKTLYGWCVHCRRWHEHGWETDWPAEVGMNFGHRIAHCNGDTPYRQTGYQLVLAGPWTPTVKRAKGRALEAAAS